MPPTCPRCADLVGWCSAHGPTDLHRRVQEMVRRVRDGFVEAQPDPWGDGEDWWPRRRWSELPPEHLTQEAVRDDEAGRRDGVPMDSRIVITCPDCGRSFEQAWVFDRGHERWTVHPPGTLRPPRQPPAEASPAPPCPVCAQLRDLRPEPDTCSVVQALDDLPKSGFEELAWASGPQHRTVRCRACSRRFTADWTPGAPTRWSWETTLGAAGVGRSAAASPPARRGCQRCREPRDWGAVSGPRHRRERVAAMVALVGTGWREWATAGTALWAGVAPEALDEAVVGGSSPMDDLPLRSELHLQCPGCQRWFSLFWTFGARGGRWRVCC